MQLPRMKSLFIPALIFSVSTAIPVLGLTVEQGVSLTRSYGNHTCDKVTWTDKQGRPRSVWLVQAQGNATNTQNGGFIARYDWNNGATAKSCTQMAEGWEDDLGGLGLTVNHINSPYLTSKQEGFNMSTGFAMAGEHGAIWKMETRISGTDNQRAEPSFRIVVYYIFRDGEDHFQYALTDDCTAYPAGTFALDSRAPYCQFDWDGDGVENNAITGFKYSSSYSLSAVGNTFTCTAQNSTTGNIPYVHEYNQQNGADDEIGYVDTRIWSKHHIGNPAAYVGASGTLGDVWPFAFQMNGYSGWTGNRMTYGTPMGSADGGGGQVGTIPGYEYYSISIMIDRATTAGVSRLNTESQAAQDAATTLMATIGTPMTAGRRSVGMSQIGTFDKPGFDQVYRTWIITGVQGEIAATLTLPSGAILSNPTFAVAGYTGTQSASLVQKNGTTLVEGTGYYCTLDTLDQQLWVTFLSDFSGTTTVNIKGDNGAVPYVSDFSVAPISISTTAGGTLAFSAAAISAAGLSAVTLDLTSLGLGNAVPMTAGANGAYTYSANIGAGIPVGQKRVTITATDNSNHSRTSSLLVSVQPASLPVDDLILFTDASSKLSDGWHSGGGNGGNVTFTEATTGAQEGSKCIDVSWTTAGWWAMEILAIDNWAGCNMAKYDTLFIYYKTTGTSPCKFGFGFTGNAQTDDADRITFDPASNWTLKKIPLASFKTKYASSMPGVISFCFYFSGADGTNGHIFFDNIKATAGSASTGPKPYSGGRHAVDNANLNLSHVSGMDHWVAITSPSKGTVEILSMRGTKIDELAGMKQHETRTWRAPSAGIYLARLQGTYMKTQMVVR